MNPIRIDPDGVPVFCTRDIDDYGLPDYYGYDIYRVIESRDLNIVSDYKMEHTYDLRPIHRYDRLARFKSTLLMIIGENTDVPEYIFKIMKEYMIRDDDNNQWNNCRYILKKFKQRKYYNRIPSILKKIYSMRLYKKMDSFELELIMNKFKGIQCKFEESKHLFKRRYFPNIRFIVFKLLELYGFEPLYKVPFIRTDRKNKSLNQLWDYLIN